MSLFGEIRHDLGRLRQIAGIMAKHGFGPAMRRIPLVRRFSSDEKGAYAAPVHERFCRMLEDLGPTFVKLGQILSTRGDLLPPEFISELSKLQDQVPPFPFEEVQRQIKATLGQPIEELFADFEEQPLASASMAQVHAATLPSGEEVVVKVQRPGIDAEVKADASILVLLAQLLELVVEEASTYRAADFAEEFEAGIAAELDFHLEARNLQTFAGFNEGREGLHVPKLYAELSGQKVMTMERIHGQRITALREEEDKDLVAKVIDRLVMLNYEHIFVDGFFHGDPHPGNVLVTDDGDIAFIDFGLVGRVARDLQDRLLILLLAVSLRDADTLARLLVRLGDASGRVNLLEFRDAIARLLERYMGLSVGEVNTSAALTDLVELSTRFGVRVGREFALLSKATVAIDGIVRDVFPSFDPSTRLSERSQELVIERIDPREMRGGGLRAALQAAMLVQELRSAATCA
jgi:ubiquinone biosynthesis protein